MGLEDAFVNKILRIHICGRCAAWTPEGTCGLPTPLSCPLNERLPIVSRAVQNANTATVEETRAAVRKALCDACPSTSLDGNCSLIDEVPNQMVIEAQLRPMRLVAVSGQSDPHEGQQQVSLALDQAIRFLRDTPCE